MPNQPTPHPQPNAIFKQMVELSIDGIVVIDMDGVVLYANPAAASMFSSQTDELIGFNVGAPAILDPVDIMISSGDKILHVEMRANEIVWEGRPALLASLRDSTNRRKMEDALQESEERYRLIVEHQTELICKWQSDTTLTYVNEAYCRFFQKSATELIGSKFLDIIPETEREGVRQLIQNQVANPTVTTYEHSVIAPDGSLRWQSWLDTPMLDANGNVKEFISVGRDITERKTAEQQLLEAKEMLEKIFTSISDAILITDDHGRLTFICPNVYNIFGCSYEEAMQCTNITELLGWNFLPDVLAAEDDEVSNIECEIADKRCERHTLLVNVKRVAIYGGTLLYVCRDVTQRKQAEDALRASESKLRQFFAAMVDVILVADANGCIIEIAPTNTINLYRPPDQLIGRQLHEIFPSNSAELFLTTIKTTLKFRQMQSLEYPLVIGEQKKWFLANIAPLTTDTVIWVARDVTEQYLAEQALKEQAVLLQEMGRIAKIGGWEFDAKTGDLSWTEELDRIHEYNPKGKLNVQQAMSLYKGKSYQIAENAVQEAVDYGKSFDIELELITSQGNHKYIRSIGQPITENGEVVKVRGSLQDITERKVAEKRLRDSEERFRLAFENAGIGKTLVRLNGSFISVNRTLCEMLGYDLDDLLKRTIFDITHPDDVNISHEYLNSILAADQDAYHFEKRYMHKDGHIIWVSVSSYLMRDAQGQPLYHIGDITDITERKRQEQQLLEAKQLLEKTFASLKEAILIIDPPTRSIIQCNQAVEDVFGYSPNELIGQCTRLLHIDDEHFQQFHLLGKTDLETAGRFQTEYTMRRKDGEHILTENVVSILDENKGWQAGVVSVVRDITERKKLEHQLIQSQKMESIGRLAGGIAHDFNNLLTAINGYAALLIMKMPKDSPLIDELQQIQKAGERAAALTQQLLAFSRKQMMQPKVLNLNNLILDINAMLPRLIGEDIELELVLGDDLGDIKADSSQLEQVLLNLIINARDAMPKGGAITIETQNIHFDQAYEMTHFDVVEGDYIRLTVSDTGEGIPKEHLKHIFEPFFTTKEINKGTGLGLSTVYGIVKQSGGSIYVYSEPGEGSSFKIYFPREDASRKSDAEAERETISLSGKETILLVEDEELVRNLIVQTLREQGYTVLEVTNGAEAIDLFNAHSSEIQLLLTDVVLPRISGRDLAEQLRRHQPALKVLYTSGYTDNAIVHHGILEEGIAFIQKPFTRDTLLRKVRSVLNE